MFRRPFILSAVAVTALLALAASAAFTRPLSAAGRGSGTFPPSLLDYTFTTIIILAVVVVIVVVPLIGAASGGETRPHPSSALRAIAIIIAVIALRGFIIHYLGPILLHFIHSLHHGSAPALHHGHRGGKHVKPVPTRQSKGSNVSFRWDELFTVLGLGALLALVFVFRPRPAEPAAIGATETLAEAISESLDDLRADPDPRRAIVAAYARMERALAASGVPRDPAEAPHEYLERALVAVDASAGAARRLTELFERAKFSQHEPDARMRDEAIDALEAIRDELWASSEIAA
jgi:Domain of unknown function (DUF4129)